MQATAIADTPANSRVRCAAMDRRLPRVVDEYGSYPVYSIDSYYKDTLLYLKILRCRALYLRHMREFLTVFAFVSAYLSPLIICLRGYIAGS